MIIKSDQISQMAAVNGLRINPTGAPTTGSAGRHLCLKRSGTRSCDVRRASGTPDIPHPRHLVVGRVAQPPWGVDGGYGVGAGNHTSLQSGETEWQTASCTRSVNCATWRDGEAGAQGPGRRWLRQPLRLRRPRQHRL